MEAESVHRGGVGWSIALVVDLIPEYVYVYSVYLYRIRIMDDIPLIKSPRLWFLSYSVLNDEYTIFDKIQTQ